MKNRNSAILRAILIQFEIAKPIQKGELLMAIERTSTSHSEKVETSSSSRQAIGRLIDRAAILARLDGNTELLAEMAEMFLQECPQLMEQIRQAVTSSDARAVEHSAHALKGAVSNFTSYGPFQFALRLEMLGRGGSLDGVGEIHAALEKEVASLNSALEAMRKDLAGTAGS